MLPAHMICRGYSRGKQKRTQKTERRTKTGTEHESARREKKTTTHDPLRDVRRAACTTFILIQSWSRGSHHDPGGGVGRHHK